MEVFKDESQVIYKHIGMSLVSLYVILLVMSLCCDETPTIAYRSGSCLWSFVPLVFFFIIFITIYYHRTLGVSILTLSILFGVVALVQLLFPIDEFYVGYVMVIITLEISVAYDVVAYELDEVMPFGIPPFHHKTESFPSPQVWTDDRAVQRKENGKLHRGYQPNDLRVVRKAIPVSSNLEKRGFPSFNCKTCGASEDDLHVFLKCPLAEEVWNCIPTQHRLASALPTVAELIKQGSNFTPLPTTGITSPLWPWVLWNLWKARNKIVFENITFTDQEVALKSIQDAKEWSQAQGMNRASTQSCPLSIQTNHTSPCPPPLFQTGVLVCKVDAAWDNISGRCGIGGVFSGCLESTAHNFSESHSHVSSALMAEAIAVHRAVALVVYSNVQSLAVLSDSLSLIKLLKKGGYQSELFGIMFDIYNFMSFFDVISFSFISRNFNSEADSVAKSALVFAITNPLHGG
ncbi:hypothetical protein F2Q70_00023865 [Brassica cretica]|uniref:RNase H type-1 domain-containing protein n=1 Tax=Brassica cretica TaxID=69181 RepID=A0A8S9GT36_BRACR|nr:hypothetical protein F2Q70_00023865 [Brassica cretica]